MLASAFLRSPRGGSGTSALTDAVQAAIWSRQPIATASHSPISSAALQTSAIVSTGRSPRSSRAPER